MRSDERGGDCVGEKDIAQKILEAHNDVFSDIVNVLLFKGKKILSADELEDQSPNEYRGSGTRNGKLNFCENSIKLNKDRSLW